MYKLNITDKLLSSLILSVYVGLFLGLTGCGQTGSLYLPNQTDTIEKSTATHSKDEPLISSDINKDAHKDLQYDKATQQRIQEMLTNPNDY